MSSGDQDSKTKQESLEEYEKDYLTRLKEPEEKKLEEKKPEDLQNIIFEMGMTKEIKKHETKDYIGNCAFCTIGVDRKEMAYENGRLFHSNCFEQQGKNFPPINQELRTQSTNTKIQLVILKNLKIRTTGSVPSTLQSRPKTKKKSIPKRKTKKKRKTARKKPRKTGRRSKRRHAKRRKKAPKRRKVKRTARNRPSRKTRRSSKPKARRRTKRHSSRKRRR